MQAIQSKRSRNEFHLFKELTNNSSALTSHTTLTTLRMSSARSITTPNLGQGQRPVLPSGMVVIGDCAADSLRWYEHFEGKLTMASRFT